MSLSRNQVLSILRGRYDYYSARAVLNEAAAELGLDGESFNKPDLQRLAEKLPEFAPRLLGEYVDAPAPAAPVDDPEADLAAAQAAKAQAVAAKQAADTAEAKAAAVAAARAAEKNRVEAAAAVEVAAAEAVAEDAPEADAEEAPEAEGAEAGEDGAKKTTRRRRTRAKKT